MLQNRELEPVNSGKKKDQKQKNEKRKIKNGPLNVATINRYLCSSPTYLGTIIMESFKSMLIQTKTYSLVVLCGGHYFAVYCTSTTFEIFDSLGFLETKDCFSVEMLNFITKHRLTRSIVVNNPVQHTSSKLCGYYVLFFITLRDQGVPFNSIMKKFSKDKRVNDRFVLKFCNKLM